jgi:hypothetical protein
MVLHLPHAEGGFGVSFNCVTKDAAFYSTTSRFVAWLGAFPQERHELWLPKDDLRDSSSWSSPPLMLLRDIHSKLLDQYGCKEEVYAQSQSQANVGAGAGPSSQSQVNIGAGHRPSSQDGGVPQQQETATLMLPQLNRLIEASFVRDESSASTTDATAIPTQHRVTQQILSHWQPFQDLKLMFAGSRRAEQLSLRSQQRVVATVEESVLKMEMAGLESQEEDAPQRLLFLKPMSWMGQIRPHRRDESWSTSLWKTFFSTSMGAQIPAIAEKPLATCGCRKFQLDPLGDHLNTCTAHSTSKRHTTGWLIKLLTFKTQHVVKNRGQHCGDIDLGGYLVNEAGPVPFVLDLRIAHDRVGSSTDPNLNGHLKYPNNFDQSLNDAAADKIRKYRADYSNRPPSAVSFMPAIASTSGRLHSEFVRLFIFTTSSGN